MSYLSVRTVPVEPGAQPARYAHPNGSTIAGARIYAETRTCRGEPKIVETTANVRGYFVLDDLAPGPVNVTITSGTFVGRFTVDIVGGREVPL